MLLARDMERLKHVHEQLERAHEHSSFCVDLSQPSQVRQFIDRELRPHFPISILVCNSGGPKGGALLEAHSEEFEAALKSHVVANHLLLQSVVPGMKDQGYGRVINIISTSVKMPIPNLGVSNTIRAAVANWAKTLSMELGPFGITVNNVLPGYTETDRLSSLMEAAASRMGLSQQEVKKLWLKQVPAGRFGQPQETAEAVGFLASPAAAYINGVNLPVDGGRTGCL